MVQFSEKEFIPSAGLFVVFLPVYFNSLFLTTS
jgi:hypothetical protein